MKKIGVVFSIVLLMIGMVGCAGAGDYNIELINDYEIVRTSAERIFIAKKESEYTWSEQLIPMYYDGIHEEAHPEHVIQVGHDNNRYIIAKTNLENYYLLDTKEAIVCGPFTKEKFIQEKENAKISNSVVLKDLDEYENIR